MHSKLLPGQFDSVSSREQNYRFADTILSLHTRRLCRTTSENSVRKLLKMSVEPTRVRGLIANEDPRVSIAALTYLTDRVAGKPSQVVRGDPDNPISITLEWTTRPEWLPAVTLNQQVTHIHADVQVEDRKHIGGSVNPFLDNPKSTP